MLFYYLVSVATALVAGFIILEFKSVDRGMGRISQLS